MTVITPRRHGEDVSPHASRPLRAAGKPERGRESRGGQKSRDRRESRDKNREGGNRDGGTRRRDEEAGIERPVKKQRAGLPCMEPGPLCRIGRLPDQGWQAAGRLWRRAGSGFVPGACPDVQAASASAFCVAAWRFSALRMARKDAVTMSSWMPTPKPVGDSPTRTST